MPDWQERITRDTEPAIRVEHQLRYSLAAPLVHASALWCDLGCGTGHLTTTLAERWPAARVVGVDSSQEMLAQAAPLTISDRLEFEQADIAAWSADAPLDLIVSTVSRRRHMASRRFGTSIRTGVNQ